ncbi:MAG TPA: hypothetical protein VD997_01355 [Phycisphaerales bacterium]|nr:hypothetical protein [Phycisphaerales bacterium]
MDRKDFRSLLSKFTGTSTRQASATSRLLSSVGRAMGLNLQASRTAFENLEQRQLLEGSINSPLAFITFDAEGRGNSIQNPNGSGVINPAVSSTDDDWYSFLAPATDFVTILADTSNETPSSSLNTRVEVYNEAGLLVASGTTNNGPTAAPVTSGPASDGFASFIATAGQSYRVKVSSDYPNPKPNLTANNTYTLRIDARTTPTDIGAELATEKGVAREFGSPVPDDSVVPPIPITPILGQLGGAGLPVESRLRQDSIVYKLVIPSGSQYNDFVTVNVQSTDPNLARRLDTRVEVYNSQGVLVASDNDAGRINDAFTTLRARPGETYYIRVRSDEIRNPNINLATGPFFLVVDALTDEIPIDRVTRVGNLTGSMLGFGDPSTAPNPQIPNPRFQTHSWEFTSLGSGRTIISLTPAGLSRLTDGALRLYDNAGNLVAFNNNFSGLNPQISAVLEGGKRYFLIVDGFELNSGTTYNLTVESNHTIDTNIPLDDHPNTPPTGDGTNYNATRRAFQLATALIWGDATPVFDQFGNVVRDHGLLTTATGQGRIEGAGDTDIFQFVPQVSMLGNYDGDNDDAGTSLFVGGAFDFAQAPNPWPTFSRNLAIWDAADWFAVGDQRQATPTDLLGFQDNPDTPGTARAEIYALYDWDLDPESEPADGLTDHVLVVGGDFDLKFVDPTGQIVTVKNLAIWIQDPNTGNFGWLTLGDTDGPVRAITSYNPGEFDSNGSLPGGEEDDPNAIPGDDEGAPQLFIGGSFTSVGGGTAANNIAFFDLNFGWNPMGNGVNGTVHALTTYDFADPNAERAFQDNEPPTPDIRFVADTPDRPLSLIVGGEFSNADGVAAGNIAAWNGVNWENLGTGRVGAIPGDPDPDDDGVPNVPPFGGTAPVFNLNGPVFSLAVFDSGDPDGDQPEGEPDFEAVQEGVLYIGGRFTQVNGQAIGPNLVAFGYVAPFDLADPDEPIDPQADIYNPRLIHGNFGLFAGAAGESVLSMTVWDPPNLNGNEIDPLLVVGGDLQSIGNFGITNGIDVPVVTLSGGTSGVVRAVVAMTDEQAPDISVAIAETPQQVLYVGGDFESVFDGDGNEWDAFHVAQFSGHNLGQGDFFEWVTPLNTGEPNITARFGLPGVNSGVWNLDQNAPAPTVFALASFDDGNPFEYDRHDRRSTKLQLVLQPEGASFLNTRVRVFDSNFNLVYDFTRPGSETIAPPFPDPSGMINGALQAPPDAPGGGFNVQLEGIEVWAGETYYIEVSGTGTGRYSFSVTSAASAPDIDGDGVQDDVNSQYAEEPDEGEFSNAFNFSINTTLINGDGTNYRNSAAVPPGTPPNGNANRTFHVTPSLNDVMTEGYDIGNIHDRDDVDIYSFRAEFTGFVEIRIDTAFLLDEFGFSLQGTHPQDFEGLQKIITSYLDAALRVFRNDFVQVGYNDDNMYAPGDFVLNADGDKIISGGTTVGTIGGVLPNNDQEPNDTRDPADPDRLYALFTQRDPRVVIPVVAGNFYFVQVESGQKWRNGREDDPDARVEVIDREREARVDHGAYRLIINQMPNQNAEIVNGQQVLDDHANAGGTGSDQLATPILLGDNQADSLTNGRGSITGVIRNTPLNPNDIDQFMVIAPGPGAMKIDVVPTGAGNGLLPQFAVFRYNSFGWIDNAAAGVGAPRAGGGVTFTLNAAAGEKFLIRVFGQGGSQGAYRVDVSGVPAIDDHADAIKFGEATEIELFDFQGLGNASGRIESPGDSDAFKFRVSGFEPFTLAVDSLDPTLNPEVTIYEVGEDGSGNPVLMRIGVATGDGGSVRFPVTPDRRILDQNGDVLREYPFYYVVVRGTDPVGGFGRYTLGITFTPTDDHPDGDTDLDGTFDNGEFNVATRIALDSGTGQGNATGSIEVATDSDLFVFTAPAGGSASIVVSRPNGSTIRTRVTILDANANVITSGLAADDLIAGTAIATFTAVRGVTYFVVVEGFEDPLNPNVNTTTTGDYTVSVIAPPVDDFPNEGEFSLANAASNIPLSFSTGKGQIGGTAGGDPLNPRFEYAGDSDLFTFTTIRNGTVTITMTPFDTAAGRIAPSMKVFDAQGNLILTSAPAGRLETITLTIPGAVAGTRYYILTDALTGVPLTTETGEYSLSVSGPASTGGNGNTPDAIDFNAPTVINLNPRTGDGQASDVIDVINDRDLFRFTTTAAGKVFVQLQANTGSLLRASIRVLNAANEEVSSEVAFDSDGAPGSIAYLTFEGAATSTYYIVVDGLGDSVGSYTVKVNTQPLVNQLVYPEGFANENIREFVSIVNPNDEDVTYTIVLRYEYGELETVVATRTIRANSRDGLTIIDPNNVVPGLRFNVPYAIVINSSKPLGATLAHYDFGNGLGDSFTETTASTFNFARVEKDPGVRDFIVFYNPNNFAVNATLTANVDGVSKSVTIQFGANRRGGFSINSLADFPVGVYGATLTVTPVNPANNAAFIGVVASLSHYNLVETSAIGLLGEAGAGSTAGVITNISHGDAVKSEVNFYNPGNSPATLTLTGTYVRNPGLPTFNRTILIPARSTVRLTGDTLGLTPDQPVGLTYTSNVPIVASSVENQHGDANSTNASTVAANQIFFGDAFIDARFPGRQQESLFFYNPGNIDNDITIRIAFVDGTVETLTRTVNANGFLEVRLEELEEIIGKNKRLFFGVDASSNSPFVASMTHYDLDLNGGWSTIGVPFGILTPLNKIS